MGREQSCDILRSPILHGRYHVFPGAKRYRRRLLFATPETLDILTSGRFVNAVWNYIQDPFRDRENIKSMYKSLERWKVTLLRRVFMAQTKHPESLATLLWLFAMDSRMHPYTRVALIKDSPARSYTVPIIRWP